MTIFRDFQGPRPRRDIGMARPRHSKTCLVHSSLVQSLAIVYPDCSSASRPVTYPSENISIPTPPPVSERENESSLAESLASQSSESISPEIDEEPRSSRVSDVMQPLNQKDLNNLDRFGVNQGKIRASCL